MNTTQQAINNFLNSGARTQAITSARGEDINAHCKSSKFWTKCDRGYINKSMNLVIRWSLNTSARIGYNY